MPLEPYARGPVWWARGKVDFNGRPITGYYRCSTGATAEAGAKDWCRAEEERQIRRHLVGDEAALTFADAVMLYRAKPDAARYLIPITVEFGETQVIKIMPEVVRLLAPKLYPKASTDTWKRQVVSPVSAVINNAHALGRCPPIRIKGWSTAERIEQDARRGKTSRVEKRPGDWPRRAAPLFVKPGIIKDPGVDLRIAEHLAQPVASGHQAYRIIGPRRVGQEVEQALVGSVGLADL